MFKVQITSLLAALLAVHAAGAGTPSAHRPAITKPIGVLVERDRKALSLAEAETRIALGTNEFRREQGHPPVSIDAQLAAAAREFASYMAGSGRYGHDVDGSTPARRAARQGYDPCIVSENIAMQFVSTGFSTDELGSALLYGWMDSPGHRANMLDADVTAMGVAIAYREESDTYYAVQLFGRPRTLQVDFSIRNSTGATLEYRLDDEKLDLPSGSTVTHERCRPPRITLGSVDSSSLQPARGDRYTVIRDERGAIRVRKEP